MDASIDRTPKAFNSNARKKIYLLLQEEAGEKGISLQDFLTSLKERTKLNLRKMSQFFGYTSIFHALQSLDDILYYKKDPLTNIVYVFPRRKYLPAPTPTPMSPLSSSSPALGSPALNSGHTLFSNGSASGNISPRQPNLSSSLMNGHSSGYNASTSKTYTLYGGGQHFAPLLPLGSINSNQTQGTHSLHSTSFHGHHSPIPTASHFPSLPHDIDPVGVQTLSPPLSPKRSYPPPSVSSIDEMWPRHDITPPLTPRNGIHGSDPALPEVLPIQDGVEEDEDPTSPLLSAADGLMALIKKQANDYRALAAENNDLKMQLKMVNQQNFLLKKELGLLTGTDLEGLNGEQLQNLRKTLKAAIKKIKKQEFTREITQQLHKEQKCAVCWSATREVSLSPCGHTVVCGACYATLDQCPECGQGIDRENQSYSEVNV
jgi:hypothetical protein